MKNDLPPEQLQQLVTVTLPLGVVLRITSNGNNPAARLFSPTGVPTIGTEFNGGIYAGLSLANEQPMALVLLPGELDPSTWQDAMAWADKQGGDLPTRIDQLVLFANLKAQFKSEVYWSCAPYAGDDAYAWSQYFGIGVQDSCHKTS